LCKHFVGDSDFIVYLGDNLIKGGIKNFAEEFKSSNASASLLLTKVKDPSRFGVATIDDRGQLVGLEEKPKQPKSNLALTGIYMLKPIIFKMITQLKPSWRNELEITDALQLLVKNGEKINYHIVEGWWKDTGTPEDILESNRLVLDDLRSRLDGKVEDGGVVQGRVSLDQDAIVKTGATVRGPSVIGRGSIIGSGVYIGPYSSIGDHVQIKRGEIEDSIIMNHCTIDVPHRITSSIIGQHTSITSADHASPRGFKLTLGENCQLSV
jgi:glucose-1-phosphate thymidylyltransferase